MKSTVVVICLILITIVALGFYLHDDFMDLQEIIQHRANSTAQGIQQ